MLDEMISESAQIDQKMLEKFQADFSFFIATIVLKDYVARDAKATGANPDDTMTMLLSAWRERQVLNLEQELGSLDTVLSGEMADMFKELLGGVDLKEQHRINLDNFIELIKPPLYK